MIFLVIYGHMIEFNIDRSVFLMFQYRLIYFVHMPVFVFLSGVFVNSAFDCKKQLIKILPTYILLQIVMVIIGNGNVKLFTPYWHLWYLLSLCIWLAIGWIGFELLNRRKLVFILLAIVVGCVSGYVLCIGRMFSLSRTIVFFPYFLAGMFFKSNFEWEKYKCWAVILFFCCNIVMLLFYNIIPTEFLYHAGAFGDIMNGALLRLVCYFIGGIAILFFLSVLPDRRCFFTKFGVNTMPAYIIHVAIISALRKTGFFFQFSLPLTVIIMYTIYMIFLWTSKLYGIKAMKGGKPIDIFSASL